MAKTVKYFFPKKRVRRSVTQKQPQQDQVVAAPRSTTRGKKKKMETQLPDLPMEIIVSILSYLPVRSLLKFRVVCKSWRSVISSTSFAAMHLERARLNPFFLADKHRPHPCNHKHNLLRNKYRESVVKFRYEDGRQGRKEKILMGGTVHMQTSMDGLICFRRGSYDATIHVVNPATRERVDLPGKWVCNVELCQLMQDPETRRYKVLLIYKVREFTAGSKIFTLGVDQQWRELPSGPHCCWEPAFPVLERPHANGCVHWISETPKRSYYKNRLPPASFFSLPRKGRFIVAFHIGREEYAVINHPPNYHRYNHCCETTAISDENPTSAETEELVESQGHLHLLHLRQSLDVVDIWVLRNYENRIWEKQQRIWVNNFHEYEGVFVAQCHLLATVRGRHWLWTRGLLSDELFPADLVIYSPTERAMRTMTLMDDEHVVRGCYVESLISMK